MNIVFTLSPSNFHQMMINSHTLLQEHGIDFLDGLSSEDPEVVKNTFWTICGSQEFKPASIGFVDHEDFVSYD